MIDWITARVAVQGSSSLKAGEVTSVDADGVLEWTTPKRVSARGSHDATITVHNVGGELEFAGSPAKFLQGHNVFGSDDLPGLGAEMIIRACEAVDVELLDGEVHAIRAGNYRLLRVDVNYSFAMGSRRTTRAWIARAAAAGSLHNRGAGKLDRSTVMWGEGSRHWMLKAYCKAAEIAARGHGLPMSLPRRGELAEWAEDKLRIELQIKARHLRELGLDQASSWQRHTASEVFREYLAKLRLGARLILTPADVGGLPSHLRPTYGLWALGGDVRECVSKAKYFRHKKALLALGINIAIPYREGHAEPMELAEYLKTPCVDVPGWALGSGLYYEPVRDRDGVEMVGSCITVRPEYGVTRTKHLLQPDVSPSLAIVARQDCAHSQAQSENHLPLKVAA